MDISQSVRSRIFILLVIACVVIFVVLFIKANRMSSKTLKINNSTINIVFANIFEQPGLKVIPFNEYFDTKVDDKIISKTSLNGQYILNHSSDNAIDYAIENNDKLKKHIIETGCRRSSGGKSTKYQLGTILPMDMDEYFLLAFSHVDDENRAYLSVADYCLCLLKMI